MSLVKADSSHITQAADIIKSGGLVAFPTETVYGLGANGLNSIAVAKIFEAKNRPSFNPLILHIAAAGQLSKVCKVSGKLTDKLINNFWPGPLTLVLPKQDVVPEIVTAGNPTVAVRMPNHRVALELIAKANTPIAAPSANEFSHLSPTSAQHVEKQLGDKVDMILDGGSTQVGVESTIIQIEDDKAYLLRPGGIPVEEIEEIIGKVKIVEDTPEKPNAPGQLTYHYAPRVPLKLMDEDVKSLVLDNKVGALFFKENNTDIEFDAVRILSGEGDLREAAANLFGCLHDLENEDLELILVEPLEEKGLGAAIMDRLRKAANRYKD